VLIALTGASAALVGLVLVFLGILVAAYQPLVGADTPDRILGRFKRATRWSLYVFGFSLASVVLDAAWLIRGGGHHLYVAVLVLFFAQLGALAVVAVYSTFWVLLKG
jgi:hypothetical protein